MGSGGSAAASAAPAGSSVAAASGQKRPASELVTAPAGSSAATASEPKRPALETVASFEELEKLGALAAQLGLRATDVYEIFKQTDDKYRVVAINLKQGMVVDLTEGQMEQYVDDEKPELLIISSSSSGARASQLCVAHELARKQASQGRFFLVEPPAVAGPSTCSVVKEMLKLDGTVEMTSDRCIFGEMEGPTSTLVNSECVARGMGIRGGARSVLQGLRGEAARAENSSSAGGVHLGRFEYGVTVGEPEVTDTDAYVESYDNITGVPLDGHLVAEGRKLEMEYMRGLDVREIVSVDRCMELTGVRPIPVRWVDVNQRGRAETGDPVPFGGG